LGPHIFLSSRRLFRKAELSGSRVLRAYCRLAGSSKVKRGDVHRPNSRQAPLYLRPEGLTPIMCVTIFAFLPRLLRLSRRRPHVPQVTWTFALFLSLLFFEHFKDLSYLILSYLFSYHHSKTKAKHVSFEPSMEAVYKSQETPLKNFLLQASSISG